MHRGISTALSILVLAGTLATLSAAGVAQEKPQPTDSPTTLAEGGTTAAANSSLTIVITANGCTFNANKPDNKNGLLVAKADVECPHARAGRDVVTELWQKDNADDTWKLIKRSKTVVDGADKAFPEMKANSGPVACVDLDGGRTRKFRSKVRVSDGNGDFTASTSETEDFGKNCLANDYELEVGADAPACDGCETRVIATCEGPMFGADDDSVTGRVLEVDASCAESSDPGPRQIGVGGWQNYTHGVYNQNGCLVSLFGFCQAFSSKPALFLLRCRLEKDEGVAYRQEPWKTSRPGTRYMDMITSRMGYISGSSYRTGSAGETRIISSGNTYHTKNWPRWAHWSGPVPD